MKLTKMHGLGNDLSSLLTQKGLKKITQTSLFAFAIAAQVLAPTVLPLLVPSETCDVRMRIINSDGSEAEMCGNADPLLCQIRL